jgi:hypothetical protein
MPKPYKVLSYAGRKSLRSSRPTCLVWPQARTLRQHGFQISIISPKGKTRDQEPYAYIEGIHIYRYRLATTRSQSSDYTKEYSIGMLITLLFSLKVLWRHGFDVIHAANPVVLAKVRFRLGGQRGIARQ